MCDLKYSKKLLANSCSERKMKKKENRNQMGGGDKDMMSKLKSDWVRKTALKPQEQLSKVSV